MKIISLFFFLLSISAGTCPNLCSGHGTCARSGSCNCYPGWTEGDCSQRTCPYDVPYVDPTQTDKGDIKDERIYLECAGQGMCDRVTGLCQCFEGYEGTACQRELCPNACSGHGVCYPLKYLDLDDKTHESTEYIRGDKEVTDVWDLEHGYKCVCDKEYTGYDCSKKRCTTGYLPSSDCDVPSTFSQDILIENVVEKETNEKEIYAYAKYTDQLGREWYTSRFNVRKSTEFESALNQLPSGVIHLESITVDSEPTANVKTIKITIKYGKYQTGRQTSIELLGVNNIEANKPGNHGLNLDDLNGGDKENKKVLCGNPEPGKKATECFGDDITYSESGSIPPLPCSRNGICDTATGLCTCFTGFYGLACTEQQALI